MKTTTVRITDEQHQWIVENRPYQLSRIVREHLDVLIHAETPVSFHNAWRESAQKCYPHMRGGYCSLCWPAGTPSRQEWTDYIRQNGVGSPRSHTFEEWSATKHLNRQTVLEEWNNQQLEISRKTGWFRRFFFKES
jgi:hypothetical protein|tara:strand:- start:74 stop:481 length:408 start_codon:yes stop_codon:yes gene_type:complete